MTPNPPPQKEITWSRRELHLIALNLAIGDCYAAIKQMERQTHSPAARRVIDGQKSLLAALENERAEYQREGMS